MLFCGFIVCQLIAWLRDLLHCRVLRTTQNTSCNGFLQNTSITLFVSSLFHMVQFCICVCVCPKSMTARLQKHEIILMRESCLTDCNHHAFFAQIIACLQVQIKITIPLFYFCTLHTEIELFNKKLSAFLRRFAYVVTSIDDTWVFNCENFHLDFLPFLLTLELSYVDFDIYFGI